MPSIVSLVSAVPYSMNRPLETPWSSFGPFQSSGKLYMVMKVDDTDYYGTLAVFRSLDDGLTWDQPDAAHQPPHNGYFGAACIGDQYIEIVHGDYPAVGDPWITSRFNTSTDTFTGTGPTAYGNVVAKTPSTFASAYTEYVSGHYVAKAYINSYGPLTLSGTNRSLTALCGDPASGNVHVLTNQVTSAAIYHQVIRANGTLGGVTSIPQLAGHSSFASIQSMAVFGGKLYDFQLKNVSSGPSDASLYVCIGTPAAEPTSWTMNQLIYTDPAGWGFDDFVAIATSDSIGVIASGSNAAGDNILHLVESPDGVAWTGGEWVNVESATPVVPLNFYSPPYWLSAGLLGGNTRGVVGHMDASHSGYSDYWIFAREGDCARTIGGGGGGVTPPPGLAKAYVEHATPKQLRSYVS